MLSRLLVEDNGTVLHPVDTSLDVTELQTLERARNEGESEWKNGDHDGI